MNKATAESVLRTLVAADIEIDRLVSVYAHGTSAASSRVGNLIAAAIDAVKREIEAIDDPARDLPPARPCLVLPIVRKGEITPEHGHYARYSTDGTVNPILQFEETGQIWTRDRYGPFPPEPTPEPSPNHHLAGAGNPITPPAPAPLANLPHIHGAVFRGDTLHLFETAEDMQKAVDGAEWNWAQKYEKVVVHAAGKTTSTFKAGRDVRPGEFVIMQPTKTPPWPSVQLECPRCHHPHLHPFRSVLANGVAMCPVCHWCFIVKPPADQPPEPAPVPPPAPAIPELPPGTTPKVPGWYLVLHYGGNAIYLVNAHAPRDWRHCGKDRFAGPVPPPSFAREGREGGQDA